MKFLYTLTVLATLCFLFIIFEQRKSSRSTILYENESEQDGINDKLLCLVLTTESYLLTRGIAVWLTWAQRCRHLVFACNCPNVVRLQGLLRENASVSIPKELKQFIPIVEMPIMHVDVEERKRQMGRKVIRIVNQTYAVYRDKMSWYYMVDDDTYVFTENLFKFIATKNPSEANMYGFKYTNHKLPYVLGGSGIVFTNESMRILVEEIRMHECRKYEKRHGNWGDITIGQCASYAGISMPNTTDEFGRARFHGEDPYTHYYGPLPRKYVSKGEHSGKLGRECCSLESIAFHHLNTTLIYQIHANKNFLRDFLE